MRKLVKLILTISGLNIQVRINEHALHIINDAELRQLMDKGATDALIEGLISSYQQQYQKKLDIDPDSLAVEIWGHVYMESFVEAIEQLMRLKLVGKILSPIKEYCAVIDCGEKGHDQNRWFWDMLAPFKNRIEGWLPKEAGK